MPLTEVEAAFAAALRGEITVDRHRWINVHAAARLGGWNTLEVVWKAARHDRWKNIEKLVDDALYYGLVALACGWTILMV